MRGLVTLLTIAIVSGLGAYVYYDDFSGEVDLTDDNSLSVIDKNKVSQVEMISTVSPWVKSEGESLKFIPDEKKVKQWRFQAKRSGTADENTMNALLNSVNNLKVIHEVYDPKKDKETAPDLAGFELDQPKAILKISIKDRDTPMTLKFGGTPPIGDNIYVQVQGGTRDGIYVVGKFLFDYFEKSLWDYESKRILEFDKEKVKRISWYKGNSKSPYLEIIKPEKPAPFSKWAITKPSNSLSDDRAVDRFNNNFRYLNAKGLGFHDVTSREAKKWLKKRPIMTLKAEADTDIELKFWRSPNKAEKEYYVWSNIRNMIFTVKEAEFTRMDKVFKDFRSKKILAHELRNKVNTVTVKFPKEKSTLNKLVISKESGKWKLQNADEWDLKDNALDEFLDELNSAEAMDFKTAISGKPDFELDLTAKEDGLNTKLSIFRKKEDKLTKLYAKLSGQTDYFEIPGRYDSKLPRAATFLIRKKSQEVKKSQESKKETSTK